MAGTSTEGEDFDDEEDANSPEKKKRILIK
jgi:hypothetical protein